MEFNPLEEHLREINRKRENIFLSFLSYLQKNIVSFQKLYLLIILVALFNALFNVLFLDNQKNTYLIEISLVISLLSIIFSLGRYLSHIENQQKKIQEKYMEMDLEYSRENSIIKKFYSGDVDEVEIRDFYTTKKANLENEKYLGQSFYSFEWLLFIFISVSLMLTVLSLF